MKLLSIHAGKVAPLFIGAQGQAQAVMSAICKQPVAGAVAVGPLGIAGDEQADLSVHGGLDKAVYLYPVEHHPFWAEQMAHALRGAAVPEPGFFGENLCSAGLTESALWVGDRLRIGGVLLEVTEPRQPCFKFAARMGYAHAVKQMLQSGRSGVYLKVIEPGVLQAGDAIELIAGRREMSIAAINERRLKGRQRELF
jgi:MOSC domain-containing protein YiiM